MITDEEWDGLRKIADDIRHAAEFTSYGYYCGGDPRAFHPDHEVCTVEELEAHRVACAAWDAGETPDPGGAHKPFGGGHVPAPETVAMIVAQDKNPADPTIVGHVTAPAYGMGVTTDRDPDLMKLAQDLDDWIDRARQVMP